MFFEDNDIEAHTIISIFLKAPLEHNNNGVTGLLYQGIKDLIKWERLDEKTYIPLLVQMSGYFVKGIRNNKKTV